MGTTLDATIAGQFLTFQLGDELFAFNVLRTNEVLEVSQITHVPGSTGAMIGIINLRGSVVPVIDLRKKLTMPERPHTIETAVIIIDAEFGLDKVIIGVLVDAAKQVIMLEHSQLEAPPKVGMSLDTKYITAIGKTDNHFVILLDSDKLFSEKELSVAAESDREVVVS